MESATTRPVSLTKTNTCTSVPRSPRSYGGMIMLRGVGGWRRKKPSSAFPPSPSPSPSSSPGPSSSSPGSSPRTDAESVSVMSSNSTGSIAMSVGIGMGGGTMGVTVGGVRMFMAMSAPLAARLSPALGPAAANGETGITSPCHPKKRSRWTRTDMSRPVRQMLRSWRLRSFALMSCNSFMSVRSDVHPPNTIETYAGVFRTLQSLLRNFHQNCIRYVVSWLRLTSVSSTWFSGTDAYSLS